MGRLYNHDLPDLPQLKILTCGREFNQPLNLSSTLQEVNLGFDYNHELILPIHLKKLTMCGYYNNQLKSLSVGQKYSQRLNLPPHLKTLHFTGKHFHEYDFSLMTLKELWVSVSCDYELKLPTTLEFLSIPKNYPHTICIDNLPLALKILKIGYDRIDLNKYR